MKGRYSTLNVAVHLISFEEKHFQIRSEMRTGPDQISCFHVFSFNDCKSDSVKKSCMTLNIKYVTIKDKFSRKLQFCCYLFTLTLFHTLCLF